MPITVGAPGSVMPPASAIASTAASAERKGLDTIWWPDHLMGWHPESIWTPDICPLAAVQPNPHAYWDPVPAVAVAAGATERVQLGVSVTELVRNHPAQLARAWLTLDHITGGRTLLGVGAGEGENITPYGIDFDRPVARLEDALRVVRLLWEHDEPVDHEGPFYTLNRAVLGIPPVAPGRFPEIWVAAHGPRMCRLTGELGDGWLPTFLGIDEYAQAWKRIREAATAAGRDPDAITAGLWLYTVMAEDHETAHRLLEHRSVKAFDLALPSAFFEQRGARHPLGDDFYGLVDYVPTHLARDEAIAAIDAIPFEVVHDATLHGTPSEIAAKIAPYADVGMRHIALWNVTFFPDVGLVRPSFDLLARTAEEIRRLPY